MHTFWPHVTHVRNQRSASVCTGKALANAKGICEHMAGVMLGRPSSLFPYFNGRYEPFRMHKTDAGAYIRYVVKSDQKVGTCDEKYWPFGLGKVNSQPRTQAYMHAYPRADGEYNAIKDLRAARELAVRASVYAGYPVVSGVSVDKAYQQNDGPEIIDVCSGKIIGGHARVWIGWKYVQGYGTVYEELGSYSDDWRVGGRAWITGDFLDQCRDLTIVHGWNAIK